MWSNGVGLTLNKNQPKATVATVRGNLGAANALRVLIENPGNYNVKVGKDYVYQKSSAVFTLSTGSLVVEMDDPINPISLTMYFA